jgi:serine/threonine protein kinase
MPNPAETSIRPCPQCGTGVRFRVDPSSGRESCPHCGYVLPTQVAHFKLLSIIGIGGMGAVYRGLDTSLERNVAVKVMREGFAKDPQFVERFLREARAAAALNHPNVAQIYSFGEQNGRYYLVIELLPNGSLDDRIEKEKRLSELEVLDIGIQVASGLKAAYEKGLIHRDIKPGNILFAQDATAKVVDFGLAKFEASETAQEEGIWGTPYYIAPEKVSAHKEDFRSDIYSLGGTLFHALAGRPPFEAGTSTEVVLKHLHSPAVSLCAWAPDCTPQSAEVIGRMLKREPSDRPQSYDELLNDLAYAKRFALEKKPLEPVKVDNDFPIGTLVSTVVIILMAIGGGIYLWKSWDRITGQTTPQPVVSVSPTNSTIAKSVTPVKPPEPPAPDYRAILDKIYPLIEKHSFGLAHRQLSDLRKLLPKDHPLSPTVDVHIARFMLMEGGGKQVDNEVARILRGVKGEMKDPRVMDPVTASQYNQFSAFVLLGQLSDDALEKRINDLPNWMQAIARFDAGLAATKSEQTWNEAKRHWELYNKISSVNDQHWVLSFQDKARDWLADYDKIKELDKRALALEENSKFKEAQELLNAEESKWTGAMRAYLERLLGRNRTAQQKYQAELEEKKAAELAKQKDAEKALILEVQKKKTPYLQRYNFVQLRDSWKTLETSIKTDENTKLLQQEIAVAQTLADFKSALGRDFKMFPYNQQIRTYTTTMQGKLFDSQGEDLIFRVVIDGFQADSKCKWSDLPANMVLTLGDFYLVRSMQGSDKNDMARRAIALAVFAREYGMKETVVTNYLNAVRQSGVDVQETLKTLNLSQ